MLPPERELIEALTEHLTSQANTAGFTDDCAVIPLGTVDLVATVDTFAQASHFPPGTPPAMAGHLAGAAALSDLAAAGAKPTGVLVGYGLPPKMTLGEARDMARGLSGVAESVGAEVLGGDTKPRQELSLAVTALGTTEPGQAMSRSHAQPGQVLVVTGPLGGASAALARIQGGLSPAKASPLLEPTPRIEAGLHLREAGVSCCMDLSDGLAEGASAIAEASGVGIEVDGDQVPLHPWAIEDAAGLEGALDGGGDYELVASVPGDRVDQVLARLEALGLSPAVVGRTLKGQGAVLLDGDEQRVLDRGYEHRFG